MCRTMCADHFSTMALPVAEFLALEHGTEYSGARAGKDDDEDGTVRALRPLSCSALRVPVALTLCGRLSTFAQPPSCCPPCC